jgi:hypothetical protein
LCRRRLGVGFVLGERSFCSRLNCFSSMSLSMYRNRMKTMRGLKWVSWGCRRLRLAFGLARDLSLFLTRLVVFGLVARALGFLVLFVGSLLISLLRANLSCLRVVLCNFRISCAERISRIGQRVGLHFLRYRRQVGSSVRHI